jgi:quinol monooxygenase YgiN
MIHVVATLKVKEGRRAEFIRIFRDNVPNVLKEKGCLEYVPTIDFPTDMPQVLDENTVTIIEKWESPEALRNHSAAPHMRAYREKVKDILESSSLRILENA